MNGTTYNVTPGAVTANGKALNSAELTALITTLFTARKAVNASASVKRAAANLKRAEARAAAVSAK